MKTYIVTVYHDGNNTTNHITKTKSTKQAVSRVMRRDFNLTWFYLVEESQVNYRVMKGITLLYEVSVEEYKSSWVDPEDIRYEEHTISEGYST